MPAMQSSPTKKCCSWRQLSQDDTGLLVSCVRLLSEKGLLAQPRANQLIMTGKPMLSGGIMSNLTERDTPSPDVTLADEDARVVDGLGEAKLEDQRLQAPLQEVRRQQRQHVIL